MRKARRSFCVLVATFALGACGAAAQTLEEVRRDMSEARTALGSINTALLGVIAENPDLQRHINNFLDVSGPVSTDLAYLGRIIRLAQLAEGQPEAARIAVDAIRFAEDRVDPTPLRWYLEALEEQRMFLPREVHTSAESILSQLEALGLLYRRTVELLQSGQFGQ